MNKKPCDRCRIYVGGDKYNYCPNCGNELRNCNGAVKYNSILSKEDVYLKISAVYYPNIQEAEITIQDTDTGNAVDLQFPISIEKGNRLANIVGPCSYHAAVKEK